MATITVSGAFANILKSGGIRFSSLSTRSLPSFSFSIPTTRQLLPSLHHQYNPCYCTDATTTTTTILDNNDNISVRDAANMLDIRVGRIVKAWRHEEADSLYVEEVDVGEAQPRIICSGLVNYISLDLLQDRKVVVLANLKPRNMRGVKSSGMLLAASDASHQNVELLVPPEVSLPGDRICFGDTHDDQPQPAPATPNQIQKKKIWELVQPHLKTDASCTAMLGDHIMRTSSGVVVCKSLKNANIS